MVLFSLNNVIGHPDALQSDNVMAYDNAVSVLGKNATVIMMVLMQLRGEVVGSGLGEVEGGDGWRQHHSN
ncbi:hypothetical protein ZIOFF_069412 [Zingiber officinale]|uniref:Uncharacterized protein n=1 Tax=Zingiber officinale TaxID=94328 RepID=A0A8J5CB45_ZINOF|nr:hypothetical protein ZIOFF_069412 [Zingiber officinale]